jgi:hypothetical protein
MPVPRIMSVPIPSATLAAGDPVAVNVSVAGRCDLKPTSGTRW